MDDLINKIFNSYNYIKVTGVGRTNIKFYKHEHTEIANYFIINSIDCRAIEKDEAEVINALEQLENEYSKGIHSDNISFKQQIIESFGNVKEASQIDKNTSAIYLLLFENIENMSNYRNAVYSIEESPNYFKRYVLPYTQKQLEQLKNSLSQFSDRSLVDALCQIADDEDNYFKLVEGKDLDSTYGLVIRMFSKLPFLQYKFKTELAPEPIEKQVERGLIDKQIKYHKILNNVESNIEEILLLEDDLKVDEDDLEKEIKKLLKGVK
ncbi:hypothetical protein Desde_1462 [Desulfitobacterium dehalogenans ATCC 51507]|uniref:Uncharacterized protein n=1 Tax=Desulfitobacterium dehalogenans (strain ATCC 51507 / DSM 9161 / JW/IU-DC1) TaxID=756499 RepID=I4A7E7_DESDJ|nr:ABC-three component system middle component 1 [Desulfitobacterium dehalogenans]AFL99881.1 hypothetical protein Desde_1462 [Desulfitobacterium dehalogenans ATCC 51507]